MTTVFWAHLAAMERDAAGAGERRRPAAELVEVGTTRNEEGFAAGKVATRAAEAERVVALWSHP
jgi:hypothetical protein